MKAASARRRRQAGTTGSRTPKSIGSRLTTRRQRGRGRAPATGGFIVALSGRNRLRGYVEEVRSDGLLAQVRLRIGDQTLTAIITGDAVRELKLRRGDDAVAIIKSTEVMIAKEQDDRPPAARRRDRRPGRKS